MEVDKQRSKGDPVEDIEVSLLDLQGKFAAYCDNSR